MPLHDAVEVNCKNGSTTENKAYVPIVCVVSLCVFLCVRACACAHAHGSEGVY